MQRSLTFACAAALAFCAMALAPAAAATETPSTQIAFADLDLNREAGAAVMLGRIERAAQAACGHRTGLMPLRERMALRTCVRSESEDAVRDVGNATLTALLYNRRPRVTVS